MQLFFGQGNIIENANETVGKYNNAVNNEQATMGDIENLFEKYVTEENNKPKTDGSWTGEVNSPLLLEGMTAVYWSTDGGITASTTEEGATEIYAKIDSNGKASSTGTDNPNFKWENWYKYVAGDNATDKKTSRWANAITDDGSYWVWIPRYKYIITDSPTTEGITKSGKVEIKFIPITDKTGTSGYTTEANSEGEILTKDSNGYIIHPAFENGSSTGKNNGYANGEWDSELAGFWIAKYEMSAENAKGENIEPGNIEISEDIKMVTKPNRISWRNIQIGQIYQNCLNYETKNNSHLIKNSEWGAVAYLTHSQYGRNRNEVTINNNNNCVTGIAGNSVTAGETSNIDNKYNTTKGMLASTTGNIYGVYDMSGGSWEYTSGWDTKSNSSNLTNNGKAVDGTVYYSKGGISDRTKTAYSNGTDVWYGITTKTISRSGEGIKETWISSNRAWFNDYSYFVYLSYPFSVRGSYYRSRRWCRNIMFKRGLRSR